MQLLKGKVGLTTDLEGVWVSRGHSSEHSSDQAEECVKSFGGA